MKNLSSGQRFVLFSTWSGAIDRCYNLQNTGFKNYGGRGIVMCDRWLNSFNAFAHDMGPRPAGLSLDRIDVNGPYSPDNCRWADRFTQARNRRGMKLTDADIVDILNAAKDGHAPEHIAVFYGVTGAHIRKITAQVRAKKFNGMPGAKLTEAQVSEIRARHAAGEKPADLADAYDIHLRNAYNIVMGHTWKHVA